MVMICLTTGQIAFLGSQKGDKKQKNDVSFNKDLRQQYGKGHDGHQNLHNTG